MNNGYPDESELQTIRNWKPNDLRGLMEYVKRIWTYADCGYWKENGDLYRISTGGWSGNEEIVNALEGNHIWWTMFWLQSSRGGRYAFGSAHIWKDDEKWT